MHTSANLPGRVMVRVRVRVRDREAPCILLERLRHLASRISDAIDSRGIIANPTLIERFMVVAGTGVLQCCGMVYDDVCVTSSMQWQSSWILAFSVVAWFMVV